LKNIIYRGVGQGNIRQKSCQQLAEGILLLALCFAGSRVLKINKNGMILIEPMKNFVVREKQWLLQD
jgi:hypothetical protein